MNRFEKYSLSHVHHFRSGVWPIERAFYWLTEIFPFPIKLFDQRQFLRMIRGHQPPNRFERNNEHKSKMS